MTSEAIENDSVEKSISSYQQVFHRTERISEFIKNSLSLICVGDS